jgi:hypothetical protein
MKREMMEKTNIAGSRQIKATLERLLLDDNFVQNRHLILALPERRAVNPLFSFFYDKNELLKWRAVTAMGMVVNQLARRDMAGARIIMRRLMWNLNDESGGIGWGSPEAMGEILARNHSLSAEYHHILMSYMMENGNYLEHEMLQRGLLWGIGRFAQAQPECVKSAAAHLNPFLASSDAVKRGLAAWAAGPLKQGANASALSGLLADSSEIEIYMDGLMKKFNIRDLAKKALAP